MREFHCLAFELGTRCTKRHGSQKAPLYELVFHEDLFHGMIGKRVCEAQVVELEIELPASIDAADIGELVRHCGRPRGIARHGVAYSLVKSLAIEYSLPGIA